MMEAIANMMVATADLVEAEGRALHRQLIRLGTAAALSLGGLLVAMTGLGFLLCGLFLLLSQQMSGPSAAIVFGLSAICLAGGLLWIARGLIR